jgi:hypothetical protein
LYGLDVTLVSDTGSPLNVAYGQFVMPETGAWQNLSPDIQQYYGWTFQIPDVKVMSDVSDVPESSTWAMMLLGFAGLGFAGYRKAKRAATFAA